MTTKKWKRILVKIGSSCLNEVACLDKICQDLAQLKQDGLEIIIVSSGAISLGKKDIKIDAKSPIFLKQAAAALGQPKLMQIYTDYFKRDEQQVAQVLLTHQDMNKAATFHNLKSCLNCLISEGVIPIINENDSVSFEEIALGDNDHLAARIAMMLEVDLVLFLTKSNGLVLTTGETLKQTESLADLQGIKKMQKTMEGSGGILSKLEAITKVHSVNITSVISSFLNERPILSILANENGSWFLASNSKRSPRHRRIISHAKSNAAVQIDPGAKTALEKNASLLPSGIKKVIGNFQRGDSIAIKLGRKIIAYGVSEYAAKDVKKIMGHKSQQIQEILGYNLSNVVIHKDFLVLGKKDEG